MDNINVEVIDDSINVTVEGGIGPQGPAGTPGANGVGVPTGGTTDQVLKKASNTDYDTVWGTVNLLPAGNDTEVQFNDGGSFGADSHFYYNKTTDILHVHGISGDATDGLLIEAQGGTDIGILGAGNSANVTWYGNHNFNNETANTIAGFGASKTLQSLSTATYPSLTELSYVKGVTSDIQTQLNNKIENLSGFDTDDLAEGTTNLYSQWQLDAVGSRRYVSPKTEGDVLYIGNRDAASALESSFSAATAMFPGNNTYGTNYFINPAYGSSLIPLGGSFVSGRARGTHASPTDTQDGDSIGGLVGVNYLNGGWTGGTTFILPGMYMSQLDHSSSDFGTRLYLGSALFEALTVDMAITGTPQPTVYINRPNADVDFQVNWDGGTAMFVQGSNGQIQVDDGDASTPALAFINDTDTGIHRVGADQMSFDTNGLSRLQISATSTVVNPASISSGDFQVHGDTVSNLIFTDASADTLSFANGFTSSEDIEVTGSSNGLILESPDASRWRITIDNAGTLVSTAI